MQEVTVEEVSRQPEENGEWLSLQKASHRTGLSLATLRRYVKRKKLKSRRLGNASNSKLQVFVTSDLMLNSKEERVSTEGLEEVLTPDSSELSDEDEQDSELIEEDNTTIDTLNWLKQRLDEKDDLIQKITEDKDKAIEELRSQLQAASFRNGYLEAQKESSEEKVKLLTEEKEALKLITETKEEDLEVDQVESQKPSAWKKFCGWFVGSPQSD